MASRERTRRVAATWETISTAKTWSCRRSTSTPSSPPKYCERGLRNLALCMPPTVDPITGEFSLIDAGGTARYCSSDVVESIHLPIVIDLNAQLDVKPIFNPNAA